MDSDQTEAWLKRLQAKGVLRLGARKGLREIITSSPAGTRRAGVVDTLLKDRERR